MKLPEIAHGNEHTGVTRLAPNIPEQLELASRMRDFLEGTSLAEIQPTQKTRELKGYRSHQPNGTAHISVAYSNEQDGRYSAEVHASHRPSGLQSHYSLLTDGEHWMRSNTSPGKQSRQTIIGPDAMLDDMLEYAPENGETTQFLDKAIATQGLVRALFIDMNRGAHFRSGSNHYASTIRDITSDGYVSAKHIELIDARINRKTARRLAVTALTNLGSGPVDVNQKLIYDLELDKNNSIVKDGVQLIHTSSDGLSPQALTSLAESSDVAWRHMDILHQALDELSRDTFLSSVTK